MLLIMDYTILGAQDCIKIRQKLTTTISFRDAVVPSLTLGYSFDSAWDGAVSYILGRPLSTLDCSFDSSWDAVVAYLLGRPS
mmetsp:Transcript_6948/g.12590  ORF Transcript_6948/g.12590 Transcript_6948/m.12590 type:complete len:82 (+) Transcript_6948:121-366(+)